MKNKKKTTKKSTKISSRLADVTNEEREEGLFVAQALVNLNNKSSLDYYSGLSMEEELEFEERMYGREEI